MSSCPQSSLGKLLYCLRLDKIRAGILFLSIIGWISVRKRILVEFFKTKMILKTVFWQSFASISFFFSLLVIIFTLVCGDLVHNYMPSWKYGMSANWYRDRQMGLWESISETSLNYHSWSQKLCFQCCENPPKILLVLCKWTDSSSVVSLQSQCFRTELVLHFQETFSVTSQHLCCTRGPETMAGAIQTTQTSSPFKRTSTPFKKNFFF